MGTGRSVGIRDVAREAGVSITTVSHALNDKGRLSDETRAHVRAVAERLGYQPSALARGLAGGRTNMLAVTVSLVDEPVLPVSDFDYYLQIMATATSAALDRGYSLTLLPTDPRAKTADRLPLDGAIVVDPVEGDSTVGRLQARGAKVVTIGRVPGSPEDALWVDNDHATGTRKILDHLAGNGSERIALLTVPPISSYTQDSLASYEAWCSEHGMKPRVGLVRGTPNEASAVEAATKLLESRSPPDAIYAVLDRFALGVLLAAEARGVKVPDELRIAGCSDSEASRSARPSLTALNVNPAQLAEEAVDLLVDAIEGNGEPPREPHRLVPATVEPRGSTRRTRARAGA